MPADAYNARAVDTEQVRHLLLRQPDGFVVQFHIEIQFSTIVLKQDDFAYPRLIPLINSRSLPGKPIKTLSNRSHSPKFQEE